MSVRRGKKILHFVKETDRTGEFEVFLAYTFFPFSSVHKRRVFPVIPMKIIQFLVSARAKANLFVDKSQNQDCISKTVL